MECLAQIHSIWVSRKLTLQNKLGCTTLKLKVVGGKNEPWRMYMISSAIWSPMRKVIYIFLSDWLVDYNLALVNPSVWLRRPITVTPSRLKSKKDETQCQWLNKIIQKEKCSESMFWWQFCSKLKRYLFKKSVPCLSSLSSEKLCQLNFRKNLKFQNWINFLKKANDQGRGGDDGNDLTFVLKSVPFKLENNRYIH